MLHISGCALMTLPRYVTSKWEERGMAKTTTSGSSRATHRNWRRYLPLGVVLFIGVLISVIISTVVYNSEQTRFQAQFDNDTKVFRSSLQANISENTKVLQAVESFFTSSNDVTHKEFETFTKDFLAAN